MYKRQQQGVPSGRSGAIHLGLLLLVGVIDRHGDIRAGTLPNLVEDRVETIDEKPFCPGLAVMAVRVGDQLFGLGG